MPYACHGPTSRCQSENPRCRSGSHPVAARSLAVRARSLPAGARTLAVTVGTSLSQREASLREREPSLSQREPSPSRREPSMPERETPAEEMKGQLVRMPGSCVPRRPRLQEGDCRPSNYHARLMPGIPPVRKKEQLNPQPSVCVRITSFANRRPDGEGRLRAGMGKGKYCPLSGAFFLWIKKEPRFRGALLIGVDFLTQDGYALSAVDSVCREPSEIDTGPDRCAHVIAPVPDDFVGASRLVSRNQRPHSLTCDSVNH